MIEKRLLYNRTKRKSDDTTGEPERLGPLMEKYIKEKIRGKKDNYDRVAKAWVDTVPEEIRRHCKIVSASDGCLKIQADSSSYKYELRVRSRSLLGELRKDCPRLGIRRISIKIS